MAEDDIITASGPEQAAHILSEKLRPGDNVLIKGSRSMRMERVIELLRSRRVAI